MLFIAVIFRYNRSYNYLESEEGKFLIMTAKITISEEELAFKYSRSSGPGGQHVNKTSTRVEVFFDIAASSILTDQQKGRLLRRLAGRVDKQGVLRIVCQEHRSQIANREAAVLRLEKLINDSLKQRPKRIRTTPTKSSRLKRLAVKKHRGDVKKMRSKRPGSSD